MTSRRRFIKHTGLAISALAIPFTIQNILKNSYMENPDMFDVIIIGGSYSGLSAAMALGRSLRHVLVIDGGLPCNRQTPHSHNFLTQDGSTPQEISALAKKQVEMYSSVAFFNGTAVSGEKTTEGFVIQMQSEEKFKSKKLIFSTGIKDIIPDIKGFKECWGTSVIHCPYCHGYEYRNQRTAIMANGERLLHFVPLIKNLTSHITILTNGPVTLTQEQISAFENRHINILEYEAEEIKHDNKQLKNILFKNGKSIDCDVLYASLPFEQHSDIPVALGCELTESGHIKTDPFQKTTIEGIFACGDNSSPMRSVANVVAGGNLAGAMVNMELSHELF